MNLFQSGEFKLHSGDISNTILYMRKPLTLDETPIYLQKFFVYSDQIIIGKALHVKIICPYCKSERYQEISNLRRTLRKGTYRICKCKESRPIKICFIKGCEKIVSCRDLCSKHYSQVCRSKTLLKLDGTAFKDQTQRMKDYNHQYKKKLYSERMAFLSQIKLESGCVDCGYNEHPAALHFDHKDPVQKSFQVGLRWGANMDKLLAEIAKCDVRCANCHAIRTHREGHINWRNRTNAFVQSW